MTVGGKGGTGQGLAGRRMAGKLPDYLAIDLRRIKPFHDTLRYGYAVGRIRVLEAQVISGQRLRRLIEADYQEALRILDEVPLGDYLVDAGTARQVDQGLTSFLKDVYSSLAEALPRDSFLLPFFLCRYDFHNLKALLKAGTEGVVAEGLLPGLGTIDPVALRKGLDNPASLPSPYRETVLACREREAVPGETDTAIDRHFLEYRLALALEERSPFVVDYARASIDLANLKLVIRGRGLGRDPGFLEESLARGGFLGTGQLKDLYADEQETMLDRLDDSRYYSGLLQALQGSDEVVGLTDFDRASDDLLMDMVRGAKRVSMGAEPVFAYLRTRENEAMTVRIILMGKLNNISPEVIERHLRKPYLD